MRTATLCTLEPLPGRYALCRDAVDAGQAAAKPRGVELPMVIGLWATVIASLVPLWVWFGTGTMAQNQEGRSTRYYVATDGSDAQLGTAAAPFRTIQHAADIVRPGDTVVVRPGTYTGGSRIVSLARSGAGDAWITFMSEQRWGAVLDGQNGQSLAGWYFGDGVGYVRVEGFEIRHLQEHGFDFYGGGVHDILIAGNHIHHIGRNCTDTRNGRTGASLGAGARRVTFDGNLWHDIGRFAPGERGCAPRNDNYQNHDHGIYVADASEISIRNNVFHAFGRGWAIHRYHSGGSPAPGLAIVNNTFVGPNTYRPGQIILATATEGVRIENNIFQSPNTAAIYFENLRFPGAAVRYNMVYGGVLEFGRPRGVTFGRNWEKTDPRFTDRSDFRLRSDSPAVDAGLPQADIHRDADGRPRPRGSGYDLGAYER